MKADDVLVPNVQEVGCPESRRVSFIPLPQWPPLDCSGGPKVAEHRSSPLKSHSTS